MTADGHRCGPLVVDVANVLGSRPDGWWRDRAGATHRLLLELAAADLGDVVAVVEGLAKSTPDVAGLTVVRAPGSGDDEVVRQAVVHPGCTVVTADRGLRDRLPPGTTVLGPGTLRQRL